MFWSGAPAAIIAAWGDGKFEAIASPEILWEYEATLREIGREQGKSDFVERFLLAVHSRIRLVMPENQIVLCRDPNDDKFLSCAIAADAAFLVSGDKDLLVLKNIGKTRILAPGIFLREYLDG